MSLLTFIEWCDRTPLAIAIRESTWLFPGIMVVHLLGLALLGGTSLLVDLRLIGAGLTIRSAGELERDLSGWTATGLLVTITSGVLLFLSEALRCYETPPFWYKIAFLVAAITFAYTMRRRVARADPVRVRPWLARVTGLVSMALWGGAATMGRVVGFW